MFYPNCEIWVIIEHERRRFNNSAVAMHLVVKRCSAIRGRYIDGRPNLRRSPNELLRKADWIFPLVRVRPEHEIRLNPGHISSDQAEVSDYFLKFIAPGMRSGPRFAGVFGP